LYRVVAKIFDLLKPTNNPVPGRDALGRQHYQALLIHLETDSLKPLFLLAWALVPKRCAVAERACRKVERNF